MAASEELARRVVEAGRSCSLTTAVLEEWSRLGTPKQVEYLAGYLEAERSVSVNLFFTSFAKQAHRSRKGGFTGCANVFSPIPVTA